MEKRGENRPNLGLTFLSKINMKIINEHENYFHQQSSRTLHSSSENAESTQEKIDSHEQQWWREKELKKMLKNGL